MRKLLPVVLLGSLAACASGPTMQDTGAADLSIPAERGRVVVYRTGIMGLAVQPTVSVDGVERGRCQPNGAFSVDVAPGERLVSASTEVRRDTTVQVEVGQISYVRCSIGVGFFIGQPRLEVVPRSVGERESSSLASIGMF
jgi:hypothetical protein